MRPRIPAHAIVIGGSIVGTVTAALLAQRVERVTIIERDSLPQDPHGRAGVPQARHVHALLARGAAELEGLFPGFLRQMAARGAQMLDVGRDVAWLTPAGWGVSFESRVVLCCATRDLIEWQVRQRALAADNITLLHGRSVTGLLTDKHGARVIGVRVRERAGQAPAALRDLHADLVVDATGRGSQLPDWLTAIGRPKVRESVIDGRMSYASRFYTVPPSALRGWRAAYVQAALPHSPTGGILFPVEGNRYHLTLFGYGDAAPATDEAGFVDFMNGLRSSVLSDVLQHATPLTPIVAHRRTENRWRHFDEMADWPEGLVAVGDSVCCFDPVYGQGMTTGILGALMMVAQFDARLQDGNRAARFARQTQRHMVNVVRPAWNLATGEDLRLPSTTGGELRTADRMLQFYLDRVIAAATKDAVVRGRLLAVMNMLSRPETLLHPATCARVIRVLSTSRRTNTPLWQERRPIGQPRVAATPSSQETPVLVGSHTAPV